LNISELPFVFKHIAVMPDCHLGKGATVGSVSMAYKDIDEVMENSKDLVKVEHTLCQVLNVKGD
jgi:RNA-splicing ligase RtcB